MSYLSLYADRRPTSAPRTRRGVRVDERTRLNLPGLYGDAYVRVFVEDTSRRKLRLRRVPPHPRLKLRVADCVNVARLFPARSRTAQVASPGPSTIGRACAASSSSVPRAGATTRPSRC
jgi:hypothetical protein